MQRTRKSLGAEAKVKKKLTKEQMQLAIIKKKECDAKALNIVMQLLEPKVDPEWLMENLKNINICHMEDVIEERAITKLCGYVLCQKPITVAINQRYHISLKEKKVYDVTKRKNFCSSSCFGASNYLLEQMLTGPLWLRDKEKIPNFKIYTTTNLRPASSHGEEVDITIINPCSKDDIDKVKETEDDKEEKKQSNDIAAINNVGQINEENVEDFILETINSMNIEKTDIKKSPETQLVTGNIKKNEKVINLADNNASSSKKGEFEDMFSKNKQDLNVVTTIAESKIVENVETVKDIIQCENTELDVIEQHFYFVEASKDQASPKLNIEQENINKKDIDDSINIIQSKNLLNYDEISQGNVNKNVKSFENDKNDNEVQKDKTSQQQSSESQAKEISVKSEKSRITKKKKRMEQKVNIVVNLAARVEQSFQEWITEETIHFLFGDDSIKQKAIEKIETQDRYAILCDKLNRLQFQDEEEDNEILEKPTLKPAPHFAILQEEGQKLELKVRAFYQGKTAIDEPKKTVTAEQHTDLDTFLPLTDVHAPQTLRRRIFLERLDQVLPDLLRTLDGNNEVYAKASLNYTSSKCTAVKALVHTFSLSAKNIIFKTAEWTLVGLVIIKMLSLLDPWLANLLLTKQANMYISMILTSYKLDPHYLNLLVASYNPNVNPR